MKVDHSAGNQQIQPGNTSKRILKRIPQNVPAFYRAFLTGQRVAKVGFEWPSWQPCLDRVRSELDEFAAEIKGPVPTRVEKKRLQEEMGDLLFALVNLCRLLKIDPEQALHQGTDKFTQRFQTMEHLAGAQPLKSLAPKTWMALWEQAKVICATKP